MDAQDTVRGRAPAAGQTPISGSAAWAPAVQDHVAAVEAAQARLAEAVEAKRAALAAADAAAIVEGAEAEGRLAGEMLRLKGDRDALLARAAAAGVRARSLGELADAVGLSDVLRERIDRCRTDAVRLQEAVRTQRLVADRSARHADEMIGLIAAAGRKSEGYGAAVEVGGGLLNAEA